MVRFPTAHCVCWWTVSCGNDAVFNLEPGNNRAARLAVERLKRVANGVSVAVRDLERLNFRRGIRGLSSLIHPVIAFEELNE